MVVNTSKRSALRNATAPPDQRSRARRTAHVTTLQPT